jgi:DNA-directed RNA polymerase specialized sigma24 family protein
MMARKLAPVGEGAGTFQGVAQTAATLAPETPRRAPALNDAQRAEIVRSYVDGKPIRAIAADFGRSYGTVHRVLTDAGVTMRGRNGR